MTLARIPWAWLSIVACALAWPAAAHFPHDPMAEIAIDASGERIVAQYLYPGRRLVVVSEDAGRTWAFVAPEAAREQLDSLQFAGGESLVAADAMAAHPWVSHDGGYRWDALSEPDGAPVHHVAPAPGYDEQPTLFAGTELGVARSDDGGATWTTLAGAPGGPVRKIAVAPGWPDDPVVVTVGDEGVWFGEDGGLDWRLALGPSELPAVVTLSPRFAEDDRLWIGTRDGLLLRSDDRGGEWTTVRPEPESIGALDEMVQDLLALSDQRLLAVTASYGVLCSDDAGDSWAMCSEGLPARTSQFSSSWGHYRRLDRAVSSPDEVVLGAWEGLVASQDGGATWEERCALQPTYVRSVGFSPAYPDDPSLWVGSYGAGVYVTRDGGLGWTVLDGLPYALHTEAVAVSPAWPHDPRMFVIGSRRLLVSADGGLGFAVQEFPDVQLMHQVVLAPDFDLGGPVMATGTTDDEGHWGVVRSDDGGVSWEQVWLAAEPPAPQITRIAFSAVAADVLYGAQREPAAVVISRDGGRSWTELQAVEGDDEPAALEVLAVDGADRVVALMPGGQVWLGGADAGSFDLVTDLGAAVIWGGVGGTGSDVLLASLDPPALVRSLDRGESWQLLEVPFGSVVLAAAVPPDHPDDPTVVASTHYGTFVSCDGGSAWQLLDRMVRWEHGACDLRYPAIEPDLLLGPGTGGAAAVMRSASDAVEVAFHGRAVRWLSWRGPAWGAADVWLDGEVVAHVDLAADVASGPVVVFEEDLGEDGEHQLRVEVTDARGGVVVDAIEVERDAVDNGPDEHYESMDWCVDLPAWEEPTPIGGGCCASGDGGAPEVQVGAMIVLLGVVWGGRRSGAGG